MYQSVLLLEEKKLEEKLRNMGCRITKQKRCILSTILLNPNVSCKELCFLAKKHNNSISHTTVYRTIKQLEEFGFVSNTREIRYLGV